MVVPEPVSINNWVIWGNFVQSVIMNFKRNVWNKDKKIFEMHITHRPTNLMRWVHQIENKGNGYDKVIDAFIFKCPMDMVAIIEPRSKGTYIFMLCNWLGEKQKVIDLINSNLLEANRILRQENIGLSSLLIRQNTRMVQLAKHPQEFLMEIVKQQMILKKGTGPAYYAKDEQGVGVGADDE